MLPKELGPYVIHSCLQANYLDDAMPCYRAELITNWHLLVDRYTLWITGNRRKDIFCCLYFAKLGKPSQPYQP